MEGGVVNAPARFPKCGTEVRKTSFLEKLLDSLFGKRKDTFNQHNMIIVSTKQELISAFERREKQIIATGEIAASIRKKVKVKKRAKVGGLFLAIASLLAIPFTGGVSAGATTFGLTAVAGAGAATLTGGEIIILCGILGGTAIALTGVLNGANVEFKPDGTVVVTPKYKD